MKRILSLLLCLVLCVGFFASCESGKFSSNSTSESSSSADTVCESTNDSASKDEKTPITQEETHSFEHYTFGSTVKEHEGLEVITSYEELVQYANGKGLCRADVKSEKNNIEFDTALFENTFENSFIIAVPHVFCAYEDSYYVSIEEYDDGTYAITLTLVYKNREEIEILAYNFDFVVVPWTCYDENMEENGIALETIEKPYTYTYKIPADTPYNNKLDKPTKEKLHSMNEGEYIQLTVWLNSPSQYYSPSSYGIPESQLSARVNGFYTKFNAYKKEHGEMSILDLPIDKFREFSGVTDEKIMTDAEIRSCLDSVGGLKYTIQIYEINKSQYEYRQQVKKANEQRNEEFCAILDMTKCRNVNSDSLLTIVSLECDRDSVLVLQEISFVSNIYWNDPNEVWILEEFDA